ncbi:MAG: YggS family pyridoxal phosphate-dependent enzyme [Oscillospiraceae bacterium]|nr:YggS family pyridoxal phosphate-dependent enzyme [Oscillospiraceae bacterium]
MENSSQYRQDDVRRNIEDIRRKIDKAAASSGRKSEEIALMAVTKTVPPELINTAIGEGITLIGENKVQELESKRGLLHLENTSVHLIGRLQTNKVKKAVGMADMIQSLDSVKLAEEISLRSIQSGMVKDVLIEINIGNEESKSGIDIHEIDEFLEKISQLDGISVKGLMTIPPFDCEISETRRYFQEIHNLFVDIRAKNQHNTIEMLYLSMGMSSDFEIAIEEGSNIVRIGSSIFGKRIYS